MKFSAKAENEIKFIPQYAKHISYTKCISYFKEIFHSFRRNEFHGSGGSIRQPRYACCRRQRLYVPFAPPAANRKRRTKRFESCIFKKRGQGINPYPLFGSGGSIRQPRYACCRRQRLYVPFAPPAANRKRRTKTVRILHLTKKRTGD